MSDFPEQLHSKAPWGQDGGLGNAGIGHDGNGQPRKPPVILIVDDDPIVHRIYEETLGAEGFRIEHAADPDQMIDQLTASRVDVLLLDEKLDGSSCWDLLDPIRILDPVLPVILLFDRLPSTPERVQAGRLGIVEVLPKRDDTNRLLSAVRKGIAYGRDHGGAATCPPPIVGQSESMRRVRSQISRIAPTSSRVLIHGESGTGKELVARWIHHLSPRSVQPFVALNCSAFPTELFEAELFGHEKGAFTGAVDRRIGKLEIAGEGTLFLDEIAELHPSSQAKLLRALQENRFSRIGGNDLIRLRARVIAATNHPLHRLVHEGTFRLDLYHRIAVIPLAIPPLRDHPEDIPELVQTIMRRLASDDIRMRGATFSPDAMRRLMRLPWPGNVRELYNTVERIVVMSNHVEIGLEEVIQDPSGREGVLWSSGLTYGAGEADLEQVFYKSATFEEFRETSERWYLDRKLREHHWNISRTAEAINMPRSLLYTKIRKHGLRRD